MLINALCPNQSINIACSIFRWSRDCYLDNLINPVLKDVKPLMNIKKRNLPRINRYYQCIIP